MNLTDEIFKSMCNDILNTGTDTKGQKVRPIWTDTNEPAYTIKKFGVCNRYDLRKEFPALTLRKTAIKSATDEILWIWQKKSNNVGDLHSHIWDEWANDDGSIGKAYGYQVGKQYIHHYETKTPATVQEAEILGNEIKVPVLMDQIDAVLYDLKYTPFSRRIMTNIYNFEELYEMNLYPCCYSCTFNVTDEGYDKLVLNMVLNQRSQDILAANNWNVVQYAVLLMMIAQVSNMIPGQLVHMIADAHIYDRHVNIIKELISRPSYDAPIVTLDPDIHNFYDFTRNSITVENYITGPQIENIPIAV